MKKRVSKPKDAITRTRNRDIEKNKKQEIDRKGEKKGRFFFWSEKKKKRKLEMKNNDNIFSSGNFKKRV